MRKGMIPFLVGVKDEKVRRKEELVEIIRLSDKWIDVKAATKELNDVIAHIDILADLIERLWDE